MLIVAHRGACYFAPENTAPAFEKAVELGVDGIETDVQLTKDGQLVIHHNYSIGGTTDRAGRIACMTLSELKKLDFGSHKGPEFAGTPIATLDECLDIVAPLRFVNLELKAPVDRSIPFVEQVIDTVKRHGMVHNVVVSAFDHSLLRKSKELCPEIKVGALTFPQVSESGNLFGIPFDIFPEDVALSEMDEENLNIPEEHLPELGTVDVVAKSRKAIVMELIYGISPLYPNLTMGQAVRELAKTNDLYGYVKSLDFQLDYLHPEYHSVLNDPQLVPKLKQLGIGVNPFTPDKPEELDFLYHQTDCFGLITNRPDILLNMK